MPATITNPTAGSIHVNVPLTNFSQKYMQDASNFVSLRAMPNRPVTRRSDRYYIFSRADFYRNAATKRAPGAESSGTGFNMSKDTFYCDVWAHHTDVADQDRADADAVVSLDNSATEYATGKTMISRELTFRDTYFKKSAWAHGNPAGAPDNINWSAGAGATENQPIKQVRKGIEIVHSKTGYKPNKMLVARDTYNLLVDNEDLLERITGGANNNLPAMVMRTLIAQLFELEEIFVMDAVVNVAGEGQTEDTRFMATNGALLYYAPNTLTLREPTAGAQFSWTGLMGNTPNGTRIKRFRMEKNEADRIEAQMAFDYKVTGTELGYWINSPNTSDNP